MQRHFYYYYHYFIVIILVLSMLFILFCFILFFYCSYYYDFRRDFVWCVCVSRRLFLFCFCFCFFSLMIHSIYSHCSYISSISYMSISLSFFFLSALLVIGVEFGEWIWAVWSTPTHWLLYFCFSVCLFICFCFLLLSLFCFFVFFGIFHWILMSWKQ